MWIEILILFVWLIFLVIAGKFVKNKKIITSINIATFILVISLGLWLGIKITNI